MGQALGDTVLFGMLGPFIIPIFHHLNQKGLLLKNLPICAFSLGERLSLLSGMAPSSVLSWEEVASVMQDFMGRIVILIADCTGHICTCLPSTAKSIFCLWL